MGRGLIGGWLCKKKEGDDDEETVSPEEEAW